MTTIKSIKKDFKAACAEAIPLARGRKMLAVQISASRSRSKFAYKIECDAHLGAVMALDRATDHVDRSELGRIRAESKLRFQKGGTASRSVVPIL